MVILQIVPLPPGLWSLIPQREKVALGFDLAEVELPWLPLSLDIDATLGVLASLLVPAAGLAAFSVASRQTVRWAMMVLVGFALASIMLGAAQQIDGEGTMLQPYLLTNPGMATGLFANRNHLATLLVMAIPCVIYLLPERSNRMVVWVLVAILLGGVVLTGSKAGMGLALMATPVSYVWIAAPARARAPLITLLVGSTTLCAAAGIWLAFGNATTPLPGGAEQHRPTIIATTLRAALDHFPAGSGGGSFLRVYQHYEDPAAAGPQYRNHAHSDYAEVLMEYGAPGAILIIVVIGWWAVRARVAWCGGAEMGEARTAVIMLCVVLAHSAVDYPLRTGALALLAAGASVIAARQARMRPISRTFQTPNDDSTHLRITL